MTGRVRFIHYAGYLHNLTCNRFLLHGILRKFERSLERCRAMPSYSSGDLIREVRTRKRWHQARVLRFTQHADWTLSRIENNHQTPHYNTVCSLLDGLEIPTLQFVYPNLEVHLLISTNMRKVALDAIYHFL